MSNPTIEQKEAIEKKGKNIIVSAGAGSGKTFVLKERVLRIVKNEAKIDNLIILTFTKNAATEMKDRIRKILKKNNLEDAKYIDSAYITTFDSFANSLVKKYNYLLNISKDFTIIDASIIELELRKTLDEIFEEKYKITTTRFENLIYDFCYKSDNKLKNNIIKIYKDLNNIINKGEYLNNYINKFYNEEYINETLDKYENIVINKLNELIELYNLANECALKEETIIYNENIIDELSNISSIDELYNYKNLKLKPNSGGKVYTEEYKLIKEKIDEFNKEFEEHTNYSKKELKDAYLSTKENTKEIIDIILELDKRINILKKEHNSYLFTDIAFMAIKLVKDFDFVREEIKNNTYEIMIDEYQDTNDIQEEFISYIANNNVYMVGDLKQSIYGFRNANPNISKEKYDNYSNNIEGYKIDLTSNFRSRKEVINNINEIFSKIMLDNVGGADYKKSHKMNFGKTIYNELESNINYNLDLLNYTFDKNSIYTKDEIEAFIIANDIKNKMNSNLETVHEIDGNDTKVKISYKDFCILVDKSKNFELLKTILEYNGIPAIIDKDLSIKNDDEIYILKNLITLLISIHNNTFDDEFMHAYMSIGRSYIYNYTDEELYEIIKNKTYKNTELYNKLDKLSKIIDGLSNKEILYELIYKFDIINKTINIGDIDNRIKKLEYFINESDLLNKFDMDIYTMKNYFDNLLDSENDIKMSKSMNNIDSVRIMTIHGSKGLEYNYVYMPYLYSSFKGKNEEELIFDKDLGLIIPFNNEGLDKTYFYKLYKEQYTIKNISEKIRLFYVAITRAKEKFIMISEFNDKLVNDDVINDYNLLKCNSYKDILTLLKNDLEKYTKIIDLNTINMTKDYSSVKTYNYKEKIDKTNDKLIVNPIVIDNKKIENTHFSNELSTIIDKNLKEILDLGTKMHYIFEIYDFKNDNLNNLNLDIESINRIKKFLNHEETKNIKNGKLYKEYEIKFEDNEFLYHGFIDLLIEYDNHFDIIDYKYSNLDNDKYLVQLIGYKIYIENTYNKPCNCYLYSILNDKFKKI